MVRCAMFLRHFFKDATSSAVHHPRLHGAVNKIIKGNQHYLFRGIDMLNALIDQTLTHLPNGEGESSTAE